MSDITWISRGVSGCKGNTSTERRGDLLITTCEKCSLKFTTPALTEAKR